MKVKIMLLSTVLISFCIIQGCCNECTKKGENPAVAVAGAADYAYALVKACDDNYYVVDIKNVSARQVVGLPDCHKKAEAVKKNK